MYPTGGKAVNRVRNGKPWRYHTLHGPRDPDCLEFGNRIVTPEIEIMNSADGPSGRAPQWEHIPRTEADGVLDQIRESGSAAHGDQHIDEGSIPSRPKLKWPLILFLVTCYTTFRAGESYYGSQSSGFIYAFGVMGILLCHEFGHFIQAVRYRVAASLPIFLPMPWSPLGTMGAVIGMSGRIPNRKALFDIGITGPLAGLVPSLLAVWFGLPYSKLEPIGAIAHGKAVFMMPPIFAYFTQLRVGLIPPGMMLDEHPIVMAGWAGIFVTALNLIPIGQLDGGHILYAMLRQRSYPITTFLLYAALAAMVLTGNFTWLLLIALLMFSGAQHPPTHDDSMPLGTGRVILGWVTLAFIFVGFTPVPIVFAP
jgi:Zn-dependent protease